jgi:hypothetical protein
MNKPPVGYLVPQLLPANLTKFIQFHPPRSITSRAKVFKDILHKKVFTYTGVLFALIRAYGRLFESECVATGDEGCVECDAED